jgi:putative membrane protein
LVAVAAVLAARRRVTYGGGRTTGGVGDAVPRLTTPGRARPTIGAMTTLLAAHCGPGGGPGWWILFPIAFWILIFAAIVTWRRRWSPPWAGGSAESTLAETYARGDIDEAAYRARLAVLRETRGRR